MSEKCKDCVDHPTQLEKLDKLVEKAKAYSIVLIVAVVVIGILMVFGCTLFTPQMPGLAEMNQFVSIVLGIVATIMSIVSMLFSFYGLEKTEESERRQNEVLQQIIEIEKETFRSTQAIEKKMQTSLQSPIIISRDKEFSQSDENNCLDDENEC